MASGSPGTRFDTNTNPDEFEKIQNIGVGGFGAVVQLVHKPTGLQLAGKMISPKVLTEENKEALRKEIATMERLSCPTLFTTMAPSFMRDR
jgi:serine/threonine protein kinase